MLTIRFCGAGREIGRSCIEVNYSDNLRLLLDCGIKIKKEGNEYPTEIKNSEKIDLAFLSHPHVDHVGAFPFLCSQGFDKEIITTDLNREVGAIMLEDSFKIESRKVHPPLYAAKWIRYALGKMVENWEGEVKGIKYKLIPSGHVPGSVSVYLEGDGSGSILYTSDINNIETRLMTRHSHLPLADILIVDSTYGHIRHLSRRKIEKAFKRKVLQTIKRGGSIVIPVFSMARAQEIILILDDIEKISCPVYLDGMACSITKLYLRFLSSLKNDKLKKAFSKIRVVRGKGMRSSVIKKRGIFISSSGMLAPSPASFYFNSIFNDSRSSIFLTGYQAMGTSGRKLLDQHLWNYCGQDERPRCEIGVFPFSAHADYRGIDKIIKEVNPYYVIAQHGDKGIDFVVRMAQERGKIAFAPRNGEILEFN